MNQTLASILPLIFAFDGPAPAEVAIRFRVILPASTPRDAEVYLSGNLKPLGGWRPDGLRLKRSDDGKTAESTVSLRRGDALEFKATLGSWEKVERTADGKDVAIYALDVKDDATVEVKVAAWATWSSLAETFDPHGRHSPP